MARLSSVSASGGDLSLSADVLVVGGSLAGAWAALSAAEAGARVILAEKGWVGTAGVVASATCGGYYLLPQDAEQRKRMIFFRHADADDLDDPRFIEGVYDDSYRACLKIEEWGFRMQPFGRFRGPDSMAFLRSRLKQAGVRVLDHSPALELLRGENGHVMGARGIHRRTGAGWEVRSHAVILATGGTAFRSGAMGTHGLTGDGYLIAAEAGAELSGMEYSGHYALAPMGSSCTKGGMYFLGHVTDETGQQLGTRPSWGAVPFVARELMENRPVFAMLDRAPAPDWERHRIGSPNFYEYFSRRHINPFTERWPVELLYEGTVRATGGLVVDDECQTTVPGLYAVGDVTDRTRLTGGQLSGAGAAIAWCVASGSRAGRAAAHRRHGHALDGCVVGLGRTGLTGTEPKTRVLAHDRVLRGVQSEILPLEKNFIRTEATLARSIVALDRLWHAAAASDPVEDTPRDILKFRESTAMLLAARYILQAARARRETRGMHRRADYPDIDPAQRHRLIVSGTHAVNVEERPILKSAV